MKNFIVSLLVFLSACVSKTRENADIEIVIQDAQSYKFDLKNEIYTVFFMSKPSADIKFNLTDKEKREIINRYFSLNLDKLPDQLKIRDKCEGFPKLFTTLSVKNKGKKQELQVDESCEQFSISDYENGKNLKDFIQLVRDIITSKKEIKAAPKSDIFYM